MVEIVAMNETLNLFSATGIENIYAESCRLADKLRDGLKGLGMQLFFPGDGSIVNFSAGSDEKNLALASSLKEAKISYALRGPGIRLSIHAFNLDSEVDKTLDVIQKS